MPEKDTSSFSTRVQLLLFCKILCQELWDVWSLFFVDNSHIYHATTPSYMQRAMFAELEQVMMHIGKTNVFTAELKAVTYSIVSESVADIIHGIFSQASMPFTLPLCYPCFSVTPFPLSANRSGAVEQVRQAQRPLDQCLTEI